MNRVEINFGSESATGKTADFVEQATVSSGGCCCGSGGNFTNINRTRKEKTMTNSENETKTTSVVAPEIVCGGCADSIKKALGKVGGVSDVDVDVASKKVTVKHGETVSRDQIVAALDNAGYSAA